MGEEDDILKNKLILPAQARMFLAFSPSVFPLPGSLKHMVWKKCFLYYYYVKGERKQVYFLAPVKLGYLVTLIMYSDFRPLRENEDTLFSKETREEGKKNVSKTNQDFSNQVRFLLQFILSAFFF